jgi:hypothetical protein
MTANAMFKDKNAFMRKVDSLAGDSVKGALSRPDLIVNTAIATREGVLTSDDAQAVWDRFDNALHNRLGDMAVVGKKEGFGSDQAYKVRVSEIGRVITAATKHPDLAEWLNESRETIAQLKKEGRYTGNTQDAFLKIVSAAKKSDTPLTEDEIVAAICPPTQEKELEEKKELERELKALRRIHDGTADDPETGKKGRPGFPSEELAASMLCIEKRLAALVV